MRPLKALLLVIAAPILLSTHVSTTPERPAANASHNEDLYVANYGVVLRYDASSLEFEGVFVSGGGGFLYKPTDLAFGPDGRLYVSSLGGSEIRRYDASGNLADIFVPAYRGGLGGPAGIAFGPDNHLYVVSGFGRVMRYDGATGSPLGSAAAPDDATLTVGSWGNMFDLAFGPDGDIYVSGWNQVIRFGRDGGFKEIFVRPQNNAGLSYATSLAFNPVDGNLYVASTYTDEVKVFYGPGSPNAGQPVGTGTYVPAGAGNLNRPLGLVFDANGILYVSGEDPDRVKVYGPDGFRGDLSSAAAPQVVSGATIDKPTGLAFGPASAPGLYVANMGAHEIVRYSYQSGQVVSAPSRFTQGEGKAGGLDGALDLTFGPGGDLYVSDYSTHMVKIYDGSTGVYKTTLVTAGSGGLEWPIGLAFVSQVMISPNGDPTVLYGDLLVAAAGGVYVYDGATGAFKQKIELGPAWDPCGANFIVHAPQWYSTDDPKGSFFVNCYGHDKIRRIAGSSFAVTDVVTYHGDALLAGSPIPCALDGPQGIAWRSPIASSGGTLPARLHVVDSRNNVVKNYDLSNTSCEATSIDMDLATPGEPRWANRPVDIAVSHDGIYYVSSFDTREVKVFKYVSGTGRYAMSPGVPAGSWPLYPWGLALGPKPSAAVPVPRGPRLALEPWHDLPFAARVALVKVLGEGPPRSLEDRAYWVVRLKHAGGVTTGAAEKAAALVAALPEPLFETLQHQTVLLAQFGKPDIKPARLAGPPSLILLVLTAILVAVSVAAAVKWLRRSQK